MSLKPVGMEMKSLSTLSLVLLLWHYVLAAMKLLVPFTKINNIHVPGAALLSQINSPAASFCADTTELWSPISHSTKGSGAEQC